MPRPEVEAIIQKLDSRGNVASAVFALTYAPYTDVEQKPAQLGLGGANIWYNLSTRTPTT